MLKHAVEFLQRREAIKTIRLDATPAGRRIYEKLGFVPEYGLVRYEGIAPSGRRKPVVTKATPDIFINIIEFDKKMAGTNRAKMLSRLFEEFSEQTRVLLHGNKIEGYITVRRGTNTIQIGPCVATMSAGTALLSDALDHCAGTPVFAVYSARLYK